MLIHLLSESVHQYVSNGRGPNISLHRDSAVSGETFDLLSKFGTAIPRDRGVQSGDTVIFWTTSGHFWQTDSHDRIRDDGGNVLVASTRFQIWHTDGRRRTTIRHGDTVVLAVTALRNPRWVEISPGSNELKIGSASQGVPASAARFTFFEANYIAAVEPAHGADVADDSLVVQVPAGPRIGNAQVDVVLSHEGLPPGGTRVTFNLDGVHAVVVPLGLHAAPDNPNSFLFPPGQSRATGKVMIFERPDPCHLFFQSDPPPQATLRVAAEATDTFLHPRDSNPDLHASQTTRFVGVAQRSELEFMINNQPLFPGSSANVQAFENYGWIFNLGEHVSDDPNQPVGLRLRVRYVGGKTPVAGKTYELTLGATYLDRPPFNLDPASVPPTFQPPGITFTNQGRFWPPIECLMQDFGTFKNRSQMLCVTARFRSLDVAGNMKIDVSDNFAVVVNNPAIVG